MCVCVKWCVPRHFPIIIGTFRDIRVVPGLTWKNSMSNGSFQDSPGELMYVHMRIVHSNVYTKKGCIQMLSNNVN